MRPLNWGGRVVTGNDSLADVNEAEGAVLGLLARQQPLSRYQILRFFQNSPARFQNVSKGSVYPLVARLLDRGLIDSKAGDGPHGAPVYSLTGLGRTALRNWTKRLDKRDMLPLDALEQRVFSLTELPPTERIAWVADAKELILAKKAELLSHRDRITSYAYGSIVYNADQERLDAKLAWLDRLLIEIAREIGQKD
jgi:DNA-binding PadR family transcriptional regulator